jgi:hypothetical protein
MTSGDEAACALLEPGSAVFVRTQCCARPRCKRLPGAPSVPDWPQCVREEESHRCPLSGGADFSRSSHRRQARVPSFWYVAAHRPVLPTCNRAPAGPALRDGDISPTKPPDLGRIGPRLPVVPHIRAKPGDDFADSRSRHSRRRPALTTWQDVSAPRTGEALIRRLREDFLVRGRERTLR